MQKHLFLVCPTDGLELKINSLCTTENYFYASLGNTFHADLKTIEALGALINNKGITQVNIVLSTTNALVLEALKGHYIKDIQGLSAFYETMTTQAQHARRCGPDDPDHHVLLSYYIHSKINTLQPLLQYASNTKLRWCGHIYDNDNDCLIPIFNKLLCFESHDLN